MPIKKLPQRTRKLSDPEVAELRRRRAAGESIYDLAVAFQSSRWTVMELANGKSRCEAGGPITPVGALNTYHKRLKVGGEVLNMKQVAEKKGMHCTTLRGRLVNGWSSEEAINTPLIKSEPSQIDCPPGSQVAYVHLWQSEERALIDASMVGKVLGRCWRKVVTNGRTYIVSRSSDEQGNYAGTELLHHLVAPFEIEHAVDVISGDGLDCRSANLRQENQAEAVWKCRLGKNNTSGFVGVSYHRRRREWYAQIQTNRVKCFIGRYHTAVEAALAVDAHMIRTRGDRARLNFPLPGYRGLHDTGAEEAA